MSEPLVWLGGLAHELFKKKGSASNVRNYRFVCLVYVVCIALRLARFNVNSEDEPSWKDNFFEGIPSPAGGIILLFPLIFSFSGLGEFFKINYDVLVPIFFIIVSILLISTIQTY